MFEIISGILEIIFEFIFYLVIRILEFFIEFFGWLGSILLKKVSNIFKGTPKRWDRLNEKHQAKLKNMRKKRREKLEEGFRKKGGQ